MILLVIRHGESEADILNVHDGRADFEQFKEKTFLRLEDWFTE